jgi:hypothetical protein
MRVARIVAVSEASSYGNQPVPMVMSAARMEAAQTKIEPGEQKLQVSLSITFELQ